MSRVTWNIAAVALLAGCAVGPSYRSPAVAPAGARVGAGGARDSARIFFDSLIAARQADSAARAAVSLRAEAATGDTLLAVAWRDILKDTTLVGLIETAARQNRDVQTAIARIREFRANLGLARAPLFPSLTANASASTNQVAIGAFPPTQFNALRLTGDVAWELDLWGRTRRGVEAAGADLGVQEASQRAVLLSLVSNVATGYLQLLELDQERAIAERTLATRQQTFALAQSRFRQGVISELDVRQFEADVSVPAATLAQAERLRVQQEHELNVLLGSGPVAIPRGGTLAGAVAALEVPDSISATLLGRRPDVQGAERAFAAATARIGVAQAARLPTVSISGNYGTQSINTSGLFSGNTEVYQLQGGLSMPLFTGGRIANQIEAARARAEQARLQYEQTVLVAMREAGDALVAVRTTRDQVAAQQTQAFALRRALQLAELRYRTGVASYLEVLDAQRGLFSAELLLSQAQLQQLSAAVQLYRAIGGSWPTAQAGD